MYSFGFSFECIRRPSECTYPAVVRMNLAGRSNRRVFECIRRRCRSSAFVFSSREIIAVTDHRGSSAVAPPNIFQKVWRGMHRYCFVLLLVVDAGPSFDFISVAVAIDEVDFFAFFCSCITATSDAFGLFFLSSILFLSFFSLSRNFLNFSIGTQEFGK